MLLAFSLGLVGVIALLWRTIRLDGLGHRPPPRSHMHEAPPDPAWAPNTYREHV
jgi:hypothetical protein